MTFQNHVYVLKDKVFQQVIQARTYFYIKIFITNNERPYNQSVPFFF